jgi:hypothetical protein
MVYFIIWSNNSYHRNSKASICMWIFNVFIVYNNATRNQTDANKKSNPKTKQLIKDIRENVDPIEAFVAIATISIILIVLYVAHEEDQMVIAADKLMAQQIITLRKEQAITNAMLTIAIKQLGGSIKINNEEMRILLQGDDEYKLKDTAFDDYALFELEEIKK